MALAIDDNLNPDMSAITQPISSQHKCGIDRFGAKNSMQMIDLAVGRSVPVLLHRLMCVLNAQEGGELTTGSKDDIATGDRRIGCAGTLRAQETSLGSMSSQACQDRALECRSGEESGDVRDGRCLEIFRQGNALTKDPASPGALRARKTLKPIGHGTFPLSPDTPRVCWF
jgi:hypothetical protein